MSAATRASSDGTTAATASAVSWILWSRGRASPHLAAWVLAGLALVDLVADLVDPVLLHQFLGVRDEGVDQLPHLPRRAAARVARHRREVEQRQDRVAAAGAKVEDAWRTRRDDIERAGAELTRRCWDALEDAAW